MPRPPKFVELKLYDFMLLAFYYMACTKKPDILGELSATEDFKSLLISVSERSKVEVSLSQLDNLFYHYRLAVLERAKPQQYVDLTEGSFHELLLRIKSYLPHQVIEGEFGQIELLDYVEKENLEEKDLERRKLGKFKTKRNHSPF